MDRSTVTIGRRAKVTAPLVATAVTAVAVTAVTLGTDPAAQRREPEAPQAAERTSAATPSQAPGLTDATITALAGSKTFVTLVAAPSDPPISLDRAVGSAAKAFSKLVPSLEPSQASLARVTEPEYGKQLETDVTKPSRIAAIVENRLAWVILFEGAKVPVLGPFIMSGDEAPRTPEPDFYAASLVVVVDAVSGEVLTAETI